jgi:hypothetical protein
MRKPFLLTAILITILAAACTKLSQFTNINVNIPYSQQISVPKAADTITILPPGGFSVVFPAYAVATNSQQYIDSFKTSTSEILRVNLSTLSMKIAGGSSNLDFLDSVQVYISGQSLPQQLVAYNYSISKGIDSLILDTVSNINLKQYFLLDTMYIQLKTHFNTIPAGNTQFNVNAMFHLLANPLD